MSLHIDHKPYACTVSSLSFQYRSNSQRHMKTCGQQSDKKMYTCELCQVEFSRKDILIDHKNTVKNKRTTVDIATPNTFGDAIY